MAKGKKKKTTAKKPVKKSPAKKAASKKSVSSAKKAKNAKATTKKSPTKTLAKAKAKKKTTAKTPTVKVTKAVDLTNFVTPLDDRVLIQPAAVERMTPGGLYIPNTVSDVSGNLVGKVVSVGRGHRNKKGHVRPMDLRVGDKVLYTDYSGTKIKIQDHDLVIVRESDVLGVVG